LPTGKKDVLRAALPVLSKAPLKTIALPSSKFTVPVGAGALAVPATAMLKMTDWPKELGLIALLNATDGDALLTT
jgi:hypothetical protein